MDDSVNFLEDRIVGVVYAFPIPSELPLLELGLSEVTYVFLLLIIEMNLPVSAIRLKDE